MKKILASLVSAAALMASSAFASDLVIIFNGRNPKKGTCAGIRNGSKSGHISHCSAGRLIAQ